MSNEQEKEFEGIICHLCGNEILELEETSDMCIFSSKVQKVHLGCLHDRMCPNEEHERL